ncbi:MAG: hypothetical protein IPJ30_10220 [Acidobacteria bacterium]|nr:hypothetical protein [Acidobacteriota bacterium]
MSPIENRFQDLTKEQILQRAELFLSAEDGLRLTDYCEIEDLAVIGIEGGTYNGSFTPDLDLIQDYSEPIVADWPRFRQYCNKRALLFLAPYVGDLTRRFYLVIVPKDHHEEW